VGIGSHTEEQAGRATRPAESGSRPRKALTIGAVCKILGQEFDDISISKIRYLEDQKLLAPRRTAGGYRLYSQADVERLRTILRLQRDEFLPLRVIRQELAAGRSEPGDAGAGGGSRRAVSVAGPTTELELAEIQAETGAEDGLISQLQEYGILEAEGRDGQPVYDETDREIVRVAVELSNFGVQGRNLRALRSSADREAALLEQVLGASLRSRNPDRRKEAVESLENLAAVCTHLQHLLLVRHLRRIAG
jgi:DNA-binding transcriptional MerR regulator